MDGAGGGHLGIGLGVELVPAGEGTTVRFVHRDLPNAEAAESHTHGWDHYLERLAIAAAGGDPGADPWLSGAMER